LAREKTSSALTDPRRRELDECFSIMGRPGGVEFVFDGLGLIPSARDAKGVEAHVSLNSPSVLGAQLGALTTPGSTQASC
jgi:hypothetical protein